jgi:hypothetical protein
VAGTLLFVEKIRQKGCTILGLIAGIFYSRARNPKNNFWLSGILVHGSMEKIAVCAHTNCDLNKQDRRLDSFLIEAAQNLEDFSKIHN